MSDMVETTDRSEAAESGDLNDGAKSRPTLGRKRHQHETTKFGSRLRASVAALVAVGAAVAIVTLASPSIASATSLSAQPDFGCYASSSGGMIEAGDFMGPQGPSRGLSVNNDGLTTTYGVMVYRWTGTWTLIGALHTSTGATTYSFSDTIFGQLDQPLFYGSVGHGYYRVVFLMHLTGDRDYQTIRAGLITPSTWYDGVTCVL
jgi:hypothetical protein